MGVARFTRRYFCLQLRSGSYERDNSAERRPRSETQGRDQPGGQNQKLQAQVAPSNARNNATQAENLLEEIHRLDRGAFVPFWDNPVVGALFLSSGGTTALQVFIWFMGR